jgi:hypothetical protein
MAIPVLKQKAQISSTSSLVALDDTQFVLAKY